MRSPYHALVAFLAATSVSCSLLTGEVEVGDLAEYAGRINSALLASNQSLLWGTYRPNLYFGMRPRLPRSLMTGVMWWGATDYQSYAKARHSCEQGDELAGYAWRKHDGRNAGSQIIKDVLNNVVLTTDFLKVPGGEHGGSWGVRIKGEPLVPGRPSRISLVQYFGLEGLGFLQMENDEDEDGLKGPITFSGSTPDLGDFKLRFEDGSNNTPLVKGPHAEDFGDMLERNSFVGLSIPPDNIWRAKDAILGSSASRLQSLLDRYPRDSLPDPALLFTLPNEIRSSSNLYAVQRTYAAPFETFLFFDAASAPPSTFLNPASISTGLDAALGAFDARFERTFPKIFEEYEEEQIEFARELIASMVGGIGYFYGSSIVDRNFAHDYDDDGTLMTREEGERKEEPREVEERELFTATPSRSFFPRGFYWDEGFHLLLIGAWDNDLSLEILGSWIDLIDEDGWVGREQILGEEARFKVPRQFWAQYPNHANPPTVILAVAAYTRRLRANALDGGLSADIAVVNSAANSTEALADKFVNDPDLARAYMASIYPKLRSHYLWFRATQRGQIREWGRTARSKTEAYRWRGRTVDHVLTSGMDDYPRAKPPRDGELHVDLMCWMGAFARNMAEVAGFVGEEEDAVEFEAQAEAIVGNLEDLHWNEEAQMYCDASIDDDDQSYFVCHKGYISIFPFLLGLVDPSSPHLNAILDDLVNPEHLWSEFGLRSLAKSDPHFGQGENYWRGPIWIPVNYMALSTLHNTYAREPGPYQQKAAAIYSQLRDNVVNNVFEEWKRTGFTWEQYDAVTGEGRRSKPFTGWTSMVAMIMSEEYP